MPLSGSPWPTGNPTESSEPQASPIVFILSVPKDPHGKDLIFCMVYWGSGGTFGGEVYLKSQVTRGFLENLSSVIFLCFLVRRWLFLKNAVSGGAFCFPQWSQPWVQSMIHICKGREALALPLSRAVISLVFSAFCHGKWCLPVLCMCLSCEMNDSLLFPRKKTEIFLRDHSAFLAPSEIHLYFQVTHSFQWVPTSWGKASLCLLKSCLLGRLCMNFSCLPGLLSSWSNIPPGLGR